MAPWSDSPNITLKEYDTQLDKRQHAAKNQGVTIADEVSCFVLVGNCDSLVFRRALPFI